MFVWLPDSLPLDGGVVLVTCCPQESEAFFLWYELRMKGDFQMVLYADDYRVACR